MIVNFKNQLVGLLSEINLNMNSSFTTLYHPYGLTSAQIRMLMEIRCRGQQTIGDLSRSLCMANGNVSSMCKKLEQDGYLQRNRNKEDERMVLVSLSPEGNQILSRIDASMESLFSATCLDQTPEDFADILKGLEKLNRLFLQLRQCSDTKESQSMDSFLPKN